MEVDVRKQISFLWASAAAFIATFVFASTARATVIAVPETSFAGLPVITFDGLAYPEEVNGLTVDGVLFNYIVGGIPTNGQLVIDGGPGVTNHVSAPLIVSPRFLGREPGTLLLTLPSFADAVGYGFSELSGSQLSDATTITLFSDDAIVGSLVYQGNRDPVFTGGFAGIASTIPFNRLALNFPMEADSFAVDNIVYRTPGVIPEPATIFLVTSGIASLWAGRRLSRTL